MKTFWSYVSTFLSGVVAALMFVLKSQGPETVINNKIGKVKQFGDGNNADLTAGADSTPVGATLCGRPSRKEIRQQRRAERRARREARRAEREKKEFMEQ